MCDEQADMNIFLHVLWCICAYVHIARGEIVGLHDYVHMLNLIGASKYFYKLIELTSGSVVCTVRYNV